MGEILVKLRDDIAGDTRSHTPHTATIPHAGMLPTLARDNERMITSPSETNSSNPLGKNSLSERLNPDHRVEADPWTAAELRDAAELRASTGTPAQLSSEADHRAAAATSSPQRSPPVEGPAGAKPRPPKCVLLGNSQTDNINPERFSERTHLAKIQVYTVQQANDWVNSTNVVPHKTTEFVAVHQITNDVKTDSVDRVVANMTM